MKNNRKNRKAVKMAIKERWGVSCKIWQLKNPFIWAGWGNYRIE